VTTKRPALGMAAAVTAVIVWGTSSVLVKDVDDLNGVAISTYRLWIGALAIGLAFVLSGGRITWRLLRLSFWGAVAFLVDIILFFSAVQITSVANATIIGSLQPLLLLAVVGPLFGERAHLRDGLWGLVAVVGAAAVVFGGDAGGANSAGGDLLAVAALIAWTAYFVTSKAARAQLTSFEYLTGLSLVSAVLVIPAPFLLGQPLGSPTGGGWAQITAIALINGALGHFLMNWSHVHVPLVAVSLLTLAIPVVSASVAAAFLDEPLVAIQIAGMAVVIGALAIVSVRTAREAPVERADELEASAALPEP
jgi:drug/metabolite transporter (DMT)-like permease